jgi:hypothetical protein
VLKTYLGLAPREPRNIPLIRSMYSPVSLLKKIQRALPGMLSGTGDTPAHPR